MPHAHLKLLQAEDPQILRIVFCCDYVIMYLLQESEDGNDSCWQEAGIRGPVYLVRRRGLPRYQLIVQDVASSKKLVDTLAIGWDLDPQENYLFFKTQHLDDKVRGFWLQHDTERQKLTNAISSALLELESMGSDEASEIEEIEETWTEASCGAPLPALDWLASDGIAFGAALGQLAEAFVPPSSNKAVPSWKSLGGKPIQHHEVDTVRATSTLSLFPSCMNGRPGGTSNARELWTNDLEQGLRTLDDMEYNLLGRTLTLGMSPIMPVALGNEGL